MNTCCHSGKLKLAFTSSDVISTSPKNLLTSRIILLISQFFCYSNSSKNVTCPSGKLKTEFSSPIAKLLSLHPDVPSLMILEGVVLPICTMKAEVYAKTSGF